EIAVHGPRLVGRALVGASDSTGRFEHRGVHSSRRRSQPDFVALSSAGHGGAEGGCLVDLYPWVVFVHVAAAFLFVMGHGASMWVSDQIKRERDPARIRVLLELSSRSLGLVYGSLLALLIAGIAAG